MDDKTEDGGGWNVRRTKPKTDSQQIATTVQAEKPVRKRRDIKGTGQDWRRGVSKVSAEQITEASRLYICFLR
jgi:hypothetical protein